MVILHEGLIYLHPVDITDHVTSLARAYHSSVEEPVGIALQEGYPCAAALHAFRPLRWQHCFEINSGLKSVC